MAQGDIVIPLGDVTIIWDLCGRSGFCQKCISINDAPGCGVWYEAGRVRSEPEEPFVCTDELTSTDKIDISCGIRCGPL